MIADLSFLGNDFVISGALAFLAGMTSLMVYTRVKSALAEGGYRADDAIIQAVVLEYTRRLHDYDKAIAELRASFDIMEVGTQRLETVTSRHQQLQPHVAASSEPLTITQNVTDRKENNGTTDYILKLLVERPRTSREVQQAIGRTREHTARLMKRLNDSGFVSRDGSFKPFKYDITEAGRERLGEKVVPPAV